MIANVVIVRFSVNVLSSSRNWPLSRTPGMMSLPRVSWMRPTMPVVAGVVPTYTARLTVEVNAPSSGIVAPSAPSILR